MTDETSDQQEKKIFVDEDWKTRVQAEKEAAKQEESKKKGQSAQQETATQQEIPFPPPSLAYLATSLATQAMMSLGLMPNPDSGKSDLRPQEAKHLIDTLEMLREKTEGNRTPEESTMFDNFLHELRLAYVSVNQHPDSQTSGEDSATPSTAAENSPDAPK